jgi:hypothetical protein
LDACWQGKLYDKGLNLLREHFQDISKEVFQIFIKAAAKYYQTRNNKQQMMKVRRGSPY